MSEILTGLHVRALREAQGISQRELGELISYSSNHVAMVEREEVPITPKFAKLVKALLLREKRDLPAILDLVPEDDSIC